MPDGTRSGHRPTRLLPRLAFCLLTLTIAAPWTSVPPTASRALAQACVADEEPNDAPETAMAIAGAVCVAGQFAPVDQDLFAWTVAPDEAEGRWTLTLAGLPAQQTRVDIFAATPIDGGGVTLNDTAPLLSFTVEPDAAAPTVRPDLLFSPGTYALSVSKSGGEGPY